MPVYIPPGARCELARCGGPIVPWRSGTPGAAPVAACEWCARRLGGVCRDCDDAVEGTPGKALRCARHKAEARRAAEKRSRERPAVKRRRKARDKRRRRAAAARERRNARRRELHANNPETRRRKRAAARRYHLARTPGYVAGYTRNNARPDRAQAKRDQALAKYYADHPVRPAPVCARCHVPIAWEALPGGKAGRPPKYHPACSPWTRGARVAAHDRVTPDLGGLDG